ncbi:hypothetical protein BDW60DRAFT_186749 [Aspergillus nidulans var. acristatus]
MPRDGLRLNLRTQPCTSGHRAGSTSTRVSSHQSVLPHSLGDSRSSILSPSPGDRMKSSAGVVDKQGGHCARNGSASVLIANQASEVGWQLQLGLGPGLANTPGRESGNDFHPLHPSLGCRSLEKEG